MITDVFLLEGPDGNRYKGTRISETRWNVVQFLNQRPSDWWKSQCYNHWRCAASYYDEELKETFTILAVTETLKDNSRDNIITHWD